MLLSFITLATHLLQVEGLVGFSVVMSLHLFSALLSQTLADLTSGLSVCLGTSRDGVLLHVLQGQLSVPLLLCVGVGLLNAPPSIWFFIPALGLFIIPRPRLSEDIPSASCA